ncbi:MAG: cell division protein ZapA [Muribaculaceae bacterium]|nr:cell division protein ZapA [Muribaculaceae bacterium]
MRDKLNITIRIADLAPIPLAIEMKDEEVIRNAEYNVNQLWSAWCQKFKDKTSNEVLGMVAFQFAKLYQTLSNRENETNDILEKFEEKLNEYLLKTDAEEE